MCQDCQRNSIRLSIAITYSHQGCQSGLPATRIIGAKGIRAKGIIGPAHLFTPASNPVAAVEVLVNYAFTCVSQAPVPRTPGQVTLSIAVRSTFLAFVLIHNVTASIR